MSEKTRKKFIIDRSKWRCGGSMEGAVGKGPTEYMWEAMSDDIVNESEEIMTDHYSRLGSMMWKIESYKDTGSLIKGLYDADFGELGIADEEDADNFLSEVILSQYPD